MRLSWPLPFLPWSPPSLPGLSPADLTCRARYAIRRNTARGVTEGWARYSAEGPAPLLPYLRDAMSAPSPELHLSVQRAAQALTEGRFSALGRDWPRRWPGTPMSADLWRLDPSTGQLWPGADTFTFDIAAAPPARLGPMRHALEFNRLQFLQPLAAAVLLSGNDAARSLIEEALASWCAANPPFRGIAWSQGIECALRAISLAVVAGLAGAQLSQTTQGLLRQALAAHAFWIDRFRTPLSADPLVCLAEATAEFTVAQALPDLPLADTWRVRSRNDIETAAGLLFHADGVPVGRSPRQGAFAAELLLFASKTATASGQPLGPSLDERLAGFARYVAWLADARGSVPAIGEDEDMRVLSMAGAEPCFCVSVARAVGGHVGHVSTGLPPSQPHLRDALLGSPAALDPASPQDGLMTFANGGVTVLRETRAGRSLTVALVGHGRPVLHGGHSDCLSLLVSIDGRPLLVDAGPYVSRTAKNWEQWFRSAAAHNTLTISDSNAGAGSASVRPGTWAQLHSVTEGPEWNIEASHGGYQRAFGVRHVRTLAATADGFSVRDRLIGSDAPRLVEVAFQLAPDCAAVQGESSVTVTPGNGGAPIRLHFQTPGDLSLSRGGGLGGGWVSTGFATKTPAWRITWRGRIASAGAQVRIVLAP